MSGKTLWINGGMPLEHFANSLELWCCCALVVQLLYNCCVASVGLLQASKIAFKHFSQT